MNILAIDFGTKNIGLAWCDTGIGAVLPFGALKTGAEAMEELVKTVAAERIDTVVVGLPLGMGGEENANTVKIRAFGEELAGKISASVEFYDERFSSAAADRMGAGVSRDERAAMIILTGFLERRKKLC